MAKGFRGKTEMISKVRKKADDIRFKAKRALVRGAEAIMTRSKNEFCPVLDGTMRGTGVVIPNSDPKKIAVTLQYGGPAAPYTIKQHEDLTLKHKPGKSAKFLEIPFKEDGPKLLQVVGEAIRQ